MSRLQQRYPAKASRPGILCRGLQYHLYVHMESTKFRPMVRIASLYIDTTAKLFSWCGQVCRGHVPHESNAHSELGTAWCQCLASATTVAVLPPSTKSGKLLDHCIQKVMELRSQLGGLPLCVYKIGITSDLCQRWQSYRDQNFRRMVCLHASNNLSVVEHLEAALIQVFSRDKEGSLRNINKGGEGMRLKGGAARFPPPYFVYCVGANAAQRELLLG